MFGPPACRPAPTPPHTTFPATHYPLPHHHAPRHVTHCTHHAHTAPTAPHCTTPARTCTIRTRTAATTPAPFCTPHTCTTRGAHTLPHWRWRLADHSGSFDLPSLLPAACWLLLPPRAPTPPCHLPLQHLQRLLYLAARGIFSNTPPRAAPYVRCLRALAVLTCALYVAVRAIRDILPNYLRAALRTTALTPPADLSYAPRLPCFVPCASSAQAAANKLHTGVVPNL